MARWSLGLVLALWLAAATVWGVLHLWIVPRISEWRPELQSLASRTLGIPVTIASLSARRDGLVPSFELTDVVLHDPASGGKALHLAKVVVAVSARSLLTLGVEQIYVEAPELTIRRAPNGQIFVAGIAVTTSDTDKNNHSDWLLSQPEIALRRGTVQWIDEQLQAPPLQLHDVDLVLRNKGWNHSLRLDATPPQAWGQRFSLMGRFKEPLLSVHEGRIERWSGQAFMDFAQVDLSQLGQYLEPQDWKLQQGKGSVRAWLEISRGQPKGMVADVAVEALQLQWKDQPQPLQLQSLQGRLNARNEDGYQLAVRGLSFTTGDGLNWPRGDFSLRYQPTGASEQGQQGERGEFRADGVDLAIASQVLRRLPAPQALQTQLQSLAPSGLLRQLQLSWRGPGDAPTHYKVSGQFEQLELRGQPSEQGPGHTGVPGFKGISGQFAFDQDSGRAQIGKASPGQQAVLSFPGVFEEPDIPLDTLDATVQWQLQGQGPNKTLKVQVPQLRFANDDTTGQAQAKWQTGAGSEAEPRFPGLLELQGQLGRANGARIHRYLPLEVGDDARHYVREAVTAGQASAVNFRVKGDLEHFPFDKAHQSGQKGGARGDFHIEAKVHDVHYQYVPAFLLSPGEKPWPALTQLSGELIFDKNSMHVRKARGMLGSSAVVLDDAQAAVDDWNLTEVEVQAKAHGPLGDMLAVVQTSALSALTEHALDESRGDGPAKLTLKLHLPVEHMQRSKVSGTVELNGNSVQLMPEVPLLSQARGTVQFSDTGFSLAGIQARALGGAIKIEGGMKPAANAAANTMPPIQIQVQGLATAKGLQEAKELGRFAQMAEHLQGQARYSLQLNIHKSTEFTFQSDLQGMGVQLPAPLGKSAQETIPVRISRRLLSPETDQLSMQWGSAGAALLERRLQDGTALVQRGSYVLAQGAQADAGKLPGQGVAAHVEQPRLDLDAWTDLLQGLPGESQGAADNGKTAGTADDVRQYLPQQLALKAGELRLHGRQLHEVSVQASHAGKAWSSQITARELAGNIEYREGSPQEPSGQLIAKLSRLTIPDAESGLDLVNEQDSAAVRELPALQISVDDFRLGTRSLGHVEVQARNQLLAGGPGQSPGLRQWQLSRFDISTAEASLTANGQWSVRYGDKAHPGDTQLHFKLALRDVGQLLKRFDMPGVVANGQGSLQGDIAWSGSPITPDFKTMTGTVHVDVQKGQFLKADPGLAKLLGVLSLQALPRRLTLDFRDVFRNGFSFDFMRGDVQIQKGIARTNNMQMKGVNAAVLMEGSADIDKETQDLHVVVVPEINAMTASLVATAINPVVGLSSFLAQMILRGPLIAANTKEFQIHGSWDDPQVVELPRRASKKGAAASSPLDEPGSNAKMPEPAPPATESPASPDAKETP